MVTALRPYGANWSLYFYLIFQEVRMFVNTKGMYICRKGQTCGNQKVHRTDIHLLNRIHSFMLDLKVRNQLVPTIAYPKNADSQPQTMISLPPISEPFLAPTVRAILHRWQYNDERGHESISDDSASDSIFQGAGFSFTRFLIFFSYDCRSFLNRLKASA